VKTENKNLFIYLAVVIIVAFFSSSAFTPEVIRIYCQTYPKDWCGLGIAPIVYLGIFFGVFLIGALIVLVRTSNRKRK